MNMEKEFEEEHGKDMIDVWKRVQSELSNMKCNNEDHWKDIHGYELSSGSMFMLEIIGKGKFDFHVTNGVCCQEFADRLKQRAREIMKGDS